MKKQYWIIISLIVFAAIITAFVYQKLPAMVASHWGPAGEVNGYMSKSSNTLFFLGLMVGLPVFLTFIPKLDPKHNNIAEFEDSYTWFIVAFSAFFDALYFFSLFWNLGYKFPINYFIIPAISLLFFAIGNLLKHAKPNYTIGIRTPWTLASEDNWNKTHELSAKAFQYATPIMLLTMFLGNYAFSAFMAVLLLTALGPVLYSYYLYAKKRTN